MFGEPLDVIMELQKDQEPTLKIPKIVIFLTHAVHDLNGSSSEGIFRVPGDADAVTDLVRHIHASHNNKSTQLEYIAHSYRKRQL